MVSWLMVMCGFCCRSQPATCSGDQPRCEAGEDGFAEGCRDRGVSRSSDVRWFAGWRRRACSRLWHLNCGSARERRSMASDPELPRFGGSIGRLHEAGQWRSGLRDRGGRNVCPLQHLSVVLHFVCELSEPSATARTTPWVPACAGNDAWNRRRTDAFGSFAPAQGKRDVETTDAHGCTQIGR